MSDPSVDIDQLFEPGNRDALRMYLRLLHPADIAEFISLVEESRWRNITVELDPETLGEVLTQLDESHRERLGNLLHTKRLIEVVDELETDDAADVLADLSDEKSAMVLGELEAKKQIESLLAYPNDSAGGIMQTEVCRVSEKATVAQAIEVVRTVRDHIEDILDIYVTNDRGQLVGSLALEDLVLSQPSTPILDITDPVDYRITADLDQEEVAQLFGKYDVATLPVVDADGILLGRITFDDVHDVLEEEATEDMMAMAGTAGEDLVYSARATTVAFLRLPWLLCSLFGSLLTTRLIPMLSHVPGDTIILAAFVPVVMGTAGNVGSQSAMIMTRGLAIGRINLNQLKRSLLRELGIGCVLGSCAALVVGTFGLLMHGSPILGAALGLSMICAMTAAAAVGVTAPAVFKKIGIDPAIAAGPLVTTSCDFMGMSIYLGVAILVLR
ncbi:MAG: magnesium transporter [Myxococcota bacterium]